MTRGSTRRTELAMGTLVTIEVVHREHREAGRDCGDRAREAAIARAFGWFAEVERQCSRFDPASELQRLTAHVGEPVEVSPMVFAAVEFAVAVAGDTGGAFDPTVGCEMERRGFDTNYRTGEAVTTTGAESPATFRDVRLDEARQTITLERPLLLDLGAVAKGLAIDMAVRELHAFEDYVVEAGGDVYAAGRNAAGRPWAIGIRHPRRDADVMDVVHVSDAAVCTSGDYERRGEQGHHLIDARTRDTAAQAVSATVVASTAMLADALATAAFVLGPRDGVALLERHGVEGCVVSPDLVRHGTRRFDRHA